MLVSMMSVLTKSHAILTRWARGWCAMLTALEVDVIRTFVICANDVSVHKKKQCKGKGEGALQC